MVWSEEEVVNCQSGIHGGSGEVKDEGRLLLTPIRTVIVSAAVPPVLCKVNAVSPAETPLIFTVSGDAIIARAIEESGERKMKNDVEVPDWSET